MSNTFKVGDEITINKNINAIAKHCTRDTTKGREYTLTHVGTLKDGVTKEPSAVGFRDDVDDYVFIRYEAVTLVEG